MHGLYFKQLGQIRCYLYFLSIPCFCLNWLKRIIGIKFAATFSIFTK